MKKNIALILILCMSAITSWAGSTKDAVENMNRYLPINDGTERVLAKIIYDEMNNIVMANYLTTWQNLVQMRKTPDFSKRAASEVLNYIYMQDINVPPFTLIVNYFADESGFEDLAKSYFVSPGQVATVQKALQNNRKKQKGQQSEMQLPQPSAPVQSPLDQQLQILASRLAEFKGFTEPQGRFNIAQYSLSKDKKDINIIVIASDAALPFFTDEQYAPSVASSLNQRLAKQYPDLEPIFNNLGLNVVIYTADQSGKIRGQYKYPASEVFANKQKAGADEGNTQSEDKTLKQDASEQPVAQPQATSGTQQSNQTTGQSQTQQAPVQSQQPVAESPAPAQTQGDVSNPQESESIPGESIPGESMAKKNATPEEMLQKLISLTKSLMPQRISEGVRITQVNSNKDALVVLVEVDAEKYSESDVPQLRELLIKNIAGEFAKKKSLYPLLLNLCCQTSKQFIYVLSSTGWSNTYPLPLDACTIVKTFKSKEK